jgi:hypothetical protein
MIHVSAHADETELEDGYIILGGFVASVNSWLNIVAPWKKILGESPAVPYFSTHGFRSEAWCLKYGISKLDMPRLIDKTAKLAAVIRDSGVLFSVHSGIWRQHHEAEIKSRVVATKKPTIAVLRHPYYFAYVRFVAAILQRIPDFNSLLDEKERLSPLDVFVDENGKLGELASCMYIRMKRAASPERRRMMGTAAPLDDKDTIPLQCADLFVGQLRQFHATGTIADAMYILQERPLSVPFVDLQFNWTRDNLHAFAQQLSALPDTIWK